jgi:signal transduction histidine kinase/AraC-like DNA-binding protein
MGIFKKQANSKRYVRTIFEDSKKNLWLGTTQGLQLADSSKSNFTTFRNIADNINSLSNSAIIDIYEDKKGDLWIGTEYGLNHFNPNTKVFTRFNTTDGLPNNRIFGILEDDNGYLWISTSKGISKIGIGRKDGKNGTEKGKVFIRNCTNYTSDDGLQSNQFNYSSRLKTKDGEMFFGGVKGLSSFYPEEIKNNKFVPPVVIVDFKLFNKSVNPGDADSILHKAISETEEIVLNYDQSFFALEYAALNFVSPKKNQYAHKLEGLDKDWIYTGNNGTASYTGIMPGNYIFRVKASNNDGIWNMKGTSIKITIKPPFWKTIPAYITYFMAFISMVLYFRHQFLARQKSKMQNELERIKAEKNHEINQIKLQFFTNVSHEFRTPLTLILGPLEKLIAEKPKNEGGNKLLLYELMQRNAQRLLRLVNQLMDFRKLEAGELGLKASCKDIIAFIANVANSFKFQAENRNITFTINSEVDEKQVWFDPDKLEKIISNLLSNAFKFTHEEGKIEINTRLDKDIIISISDSGIGIHKENLQSIFKRFYQVPKMQTSEKVGTGIGLALTKELVELHKGIISVDSEVGKGTCFTIRIPTGLKSVEQEQTISKFVIPEEKEVTPNNITEEENKSDVEKPVTIKKDSPLLLIVEDNDDMRLFIKNELISLYRIVVAPNGKEGIKKAFDAMPDLIISDVMMPEVTGFELCNTLKTDERTSHIPIILLTSLSSKENKLLGLETSADDYISKPFNIEILRARIKNLINSRIKLREYFLRRLTPINDSATAESLDDKFLKRAIDLVNKNIADFNFSNDEFIAQIGMSRTALYSKLKSLTNLTVSEFIQSMRMRKAEQLLKDGSATISNVAYNVGFKNPSHFSRCFRKHFNITPVDYVKKHSPK